MRVLTRPAPASASAALAGELKGQSRGDRISWGRLRLFTVAIDDRVLRAVRDLAQVGKVRQLIVDDLHLRDLSSLDWSGGPLHLRSVRGELERVASGEVEYLVVRAPTGEPVAKGGIDYAKHDDAGMLWQLATHPQLQSLGIGTLLVSEALARIRRRGCGWAVLGVEDHNPQARALYERLGFQPFAREDASWEQEDSTGQLVLYETQLALLRRRP